MPIPSHLSHPAAPLLHVLEKSILPALEWNAETHIAIARAQREQLVLPPGVRAVPLELRGRRVAVRHSRAFQRAVLLSANWPQDGLHELRIPKLAAVVAGQAGLRAGDYVLQCPAGTLLFLPSGVPHSDSTFSHLETLPPDVTQCSILWFTPMMSGLACRMCHTNGEKHSTNARGEKLFLHHPQAMQLFSMLAEEAEYSDNTDVPVFAGLLLALMRTVRRDIRDERFLLQEVPPHEGEERVVAGDPIEQAIHYINAHYASPLALGDVARRFFLSRAQFTRKFRERTGHSFLEYLNARRLEQARRLLVETDWTAVMIARYVGFGSSIYFHRRFLREAGVSPMQFRRQARSRSHSKDASRPENHA